MATYSRKTIQCPKCRREVSGLWPVNGGICGDCLVTNVPLQDALTNTCSCLHTEIIELYKQYERRGVINKPRGQ